MKESQIKQKITMAARRPHRHGTTEEALQANHAPDQADPHASNGQDYEGKNQGIIHDNSDVGLNPARRRRHDAGDIGSDSGHRSGRRSLRKHSFLVIYVSSGQRAGTQRRGYRGR